MFPLKRSNRARDRPRNRGRNRAPEEKGTAKGTVVPRSSRAPCTPRTSSRQRAMVPPPILASGARLSLLFSSSVSLQRSISRPKLTQYVCTIAVVSVSLEPLPQRSRRNTRHRAATLVSHARDDRSIDCSLFHPDRAPVRFARNLSPRSSNRVASIESTVATRIENAPSNGKPGLLRRNRSFCSTHRSSSGRE